MAEQRDELSCTRCGKPINPDRATWLEFDNHTALYVPIGAVPARHESLGCYPFGPECKNKPNEE